MNKLIKTLFYIQEWKPYYRVLTQEERQMELESYCSVPHKYIPIPVPPNMWAADTFIVKKDDSYIAYFEYMNCKKNKAVIASKDIVELSSEINICYEFSGHTSYPAIFEFRNALFMIPETVYSNSVNLLRLSDYSGEWVFEKKICDGIFPDSTVFQMNGQLYLYRYSPDGLLLLSKMDSTTFEIKDTQIIYRYEKGVGRPAGNLFFEKDNIYRPTQFNKRFYGERIDFYRVDTTNFSESFAFSFSAKNIIISEKGRLIGTHTFNRCDNFEIIDVLFLRFSLFKVFRAIFKRIGIFGFSNYEKKEKYLYKNEKNN